MEDVLEGPISRFPGPVCNIYGGWTDSQPATGAEKSSHPGDPGLGNTLEIWESFLKSGEHLGNMGNPVEIAGTFLLYNQPCLMYLGFCKPFLADFVFWTKCYVFADF